MKTKQTLDNLERLFKRVINWEMEPFIEIEPQEQGGDGTKTIYFPEISSLEFNFDIDYLDKPATEWAVTRIGTFEAKIQTFLGTRLKKRNSTLKNPDDIPFCHLVNIAKDSFGYDGWQDEVIDTTITSEEETVDEIGEPRYSLNTESIVRITLKDGTYHDDIGYGRADYLPSKSQAYSKSKKESITDGKKRGLQNLKNILFDYELNRRRGSDIYSDVFN